MSRTRVLETPFPSALPPLRAGAELDVESLREPGEQLFAGLLFAFNAVVFIVLAVAIVMAPIPMAVLLLYVGGFAFLMWVSTKLICTGLRRGQSARQPFLRAVRRGGGGQPVGVMILLYAVPSPGGLCNGDCCSWGAGSLATNGK